MSKLARAYSDYAARSPARWQKLAAVVLSIGLPLLLLDRRGIAVALAALAYAPVLLTGAFRHGAVLGWTSAHPVVDALVAMPLAFFALACLTEMPLALCAAVAVAVGVALAAVAARRD